MTPGSHTIVTGTERPKGPSVRDTILILMPSRALTVMICREPPEGTVAQNVLKYRHGGLNIDGCRIQSETISTHSRGTNQAFPKRPHDKSPEDSGRIKNQGDIESNPRTGRWPTNILLVHDTGCVRVEDKRVKGAARHGPSAHAIMGFHGRNVFQGTPVTEHTASDGTETVPAWDCQPDCPVRLLDAMSGVLKTGACNPTPRANRGGFSGPMPKIGLGHRADVGTASRFFPQFACLEDAMTWVRTLIGEPTL